MISRRAFLAGAGAAAAAPLIPLPVPAAASVAAGAGVADSLVFISTPAVHDGALLYSQYAEATLRQIVNIYGLSYNDLTGMWRLPDARPE